MNAEIRDKQEFIRRAMINAKGDDMERASLGFKRYSEEQLKAEYGQSGKTAQEVWNEYKSARAQWEDANEYLERLLKQDAV